MPTWAGLVVGWQSWWGCGWLEHFAGFLASMQLKPTTKQTLLHHKATARGTAAVVVAAMATKPLWVGCPSKGAATIQIHAAKAGVLPAVTNFENQLNQIKGAAVAFLPIAWPPFWGLNLVATRHRVKRLPGQVPPNWHT